MYLDTSNKYECSGCMACSQVCNQDAINFREDEEGFFYPVIDIHRCVKCDLCKKICPNNQVHRLLHSCKESCAYAAIHTHKDVWLESSSGGAFSSIVDSYTRCTGSGRITEIFGATWDIENWSVFHKVSTKVSPFRKSKYIQSRINTTYFDVKKSLENGKNVVFSGTPCQVAGLKAYLKHDYDNLLLVDIICHGVANHKIFLKFLNELEKTFHSSVSRIEFRHKVRTWHGYNSRNLLVEFKNGKRYIGSAEECDFLRGYHKALYYRPSCYECQYARKERVSDITIGDFWKLTDQIEFDIEPVSGVSMILSNTDKGKEVIKHILYMKLKCVEYDFAVKSNKQLHTASIPHKNRKLFFENYDRCTFKENLKVCIPISKKYYVQKLYRKLFSEKTIRKVKKCLKK